MNRLKTVIGIGELLWDMLPTGKKLGGAPANFAYHAGLFGHRAIALSRVGDDALGAELVEDVRAHGLEIDYVQRDQEHPTGTVNVELHDGHPSYEIVENVAWDFMEASPYWMQLAATADAICFGTLAQRNAVSRRAIRSIVGAVPRASFRIFDVNLRQRYYDAAIVDESLKMCNVFKLNDQELPVICELLKIEGASARDRCAEVVKRYGLKLLAMTRGKDGSLFVTPEGIYEHPGVPAVVKDTVGAGDAFTGGMAHGLLGNMSLQEIAQVANERGAWVAGQEGAMPHADTFAR